MQLHNRVSTNSGMDYWNGTLDWTTGMIFLTFNLLFLLAMLAYSYFENYVRDESSKMWAHKHIDFLCA